jgi:hypothetical protein
VKTTTLALVMGFLVLPSAALASYEVRLTNGKAFVVHAYWEEDNQIRFYCDGGAVGIPRGVVSEILECGEAQDVSRDQMKPPVHRTRGLTGGTTRDEGKEVILAILRPQPPADSLSSMDESFGGKDRNLISETGVKLQAGIETRKTQLKRVLDRALERFRDASRNRDPEEKRKAIEEMTRASGQLVELTARREKTKNAVNRN